MSEKSGYEESKKREQKSEESFDKEDAEYDENAPPRTNAQGGQM